MKSLVLLLMTIAIVLGIRATSEEVNNFVQSIAIVLVNIVGITAIVEEPALEKMQRCSVTMNEVLHLQPERNCFIQI